MTEQPPPPDQTNDLATSQGVFLPPAQVIGLAKMYVQWRPIIGWAAKFAKQKIPQELDEAMEMVAASGDPAALRRLSERENSSANPQQYDPYEVANERVPGEPVMTRDLAEVAWQMRQDGMSVRDIALELSKAEGPIHYSTVNRWINIIDEEMRSNKTLFLRSIAKYIAFSALFVGTVLLMHFLRL